ncbi:MAG: proline iminopeptidase-family hydrolase [Cryomorphaceae bacterium]|nr:proline iminopeptidase-family hydrolase [Cryomorphaceae bacterium]
MPLTRYLFSILFFVIPLFSPVGFGQNPNLESGQGFVEVEGGRMWYRIIGSGEETPLIMMHGGPGGTSFGLFSLGDLSTDRPLIYFDQLGGGRSDHHRDTTLLTVDHFVEQVFALVHHLKLNTFYLYGHSWGTTLALEYYLKYPEGVQGIVFNSPYFNTGEWIADADTLILALHDTIQDIIRDYSAREDYDNNMFRFAESVYLKNYGRRGERVSTKWDMNYKPGNGFIYTYMWGQTEFTATGKLKNYNRSKALESLEIPCLFITGEYDEARPATVKRQAERAPKGEFAIVPNAGHATMHDNNEENINLIRRFLHKIEEKP